MKKSALLFALVFNISLIFVKVTIAYDGHGYPYTHTSGCTDVCYGDSYNFCQNNCTSYAAYVLNEYGVPFTNSYMSTTWSHGTNWDDRANGVGISVDSQPIPGDIAYWNSMDEEDIYGHVAWVEKVHFDGNGNATQIDITEYNYVSCSFSQRTISADNPDGFIHILAYNEGVTGLFYLDSYEMSNESDSVCCQTKQEWEWIVNRVWSDYRCQEDCGGLYDPDYIAALTDYVGGMGGFDPGDDGTTPDGPDGNVKRLEISDDGTHWHHSFNAYPGQTLQTEITITNKGDETIGYFEVFVHRSPDLNFDEDNDYSYGREEETDDLDPGESDKKHRTIKAPSTPGTYYIFAYINRVDGEDGGSDQDWTNNYSRNDDYEEFARLIVDSPPQGYLDSADCTNIRGWAKDPNTTSPIAVHFYKDAPAGTGTFFGSILADNYRGDLPYSDKNHGFDLTTPDSLKDGKVHNVYVYAIDSGGGDNPLIGSSGVLCVQGVPYGKPVYRFWYPEINDHFYTISESEKEKLIDEGVYKYEFVAFYAFNSQEIGTSPVFRFWNKSIGDHFYTISESERDKLIADPGWNYEGIVFYVYSYSEVDAIPVYRLYNENLHDHFYTTDEAAKDDLVQNHGWRDEGIAWYIPSQNTSPPNSLFSFSPNSGIATLKVDFQNLSTGSVKSVKWEFGDGSTSTQDSPSHSYCAKGTYTVKLTAYGPQGWEDSTEKNACITVFSPVNCSFAASPTSGIAPLRVGFYDLSIGDINSWQWNFGDGAGSTARDPFHTYAEPGTYTVSLNVSGSGGYDAETRSGYIRVRSAEDVWDPTPILLLLLDK